MVGRRWQKKCWIKCPSIVSGQARSSFLCGSQNKTRRRVLTLLLVEDRMTLKFMSHSAIVDQNDLIASFSLSS